MSRRAGFFTAMVVLLLVAGWWQPAPKVISVAGPVVEASLVVSPSDVVAAQQSAAEAPKPEPTPPPPVEAAPPPPPLPAPQPQDAPDEAQPTPQDRIPEPSPVEQDAVARLALEQEQAVDPGRRDPRELVAVVHVLVPPRGLAHVAVALGRDALEDELAAERREPFAAEVEDEGAVPGRDGLH